MRRSLIIAILSAVALWASFPPVRWPILAFVGPAGLMLASVTAPNRRSAAAAGAAFGAVFIGILMEWIANLGMEAMIGLIVAQLPFYASYGALLWGFRAKPSWELGIVATGGWALLEFLRERVPMGGLNWGAIGYPVGEWVSIRGLAQWVGTSGIGVLVAGVAAGLMLFTLRREIRPAAGMAMTVLVLAALGAVGADPPAGPTVRVAVVQGNSPCPLEHCAGERELIFQNHLRLTRRLPAGSVDLVVWPESSTTFSTDPAGTSEEQLAVAGEARRLGATVLVGGDRSGTEDTFINSNVVFGPNGELVGEYLKNHPVPFGEYVPLRAVFGLIPETSRVPRDMVRGDGPTVFPAPFGSLGSVISFEGAFARYGREAVMNGARLLVVASNEASYGISSAADQFIGMTRMRSAENGVDVVHAAVSGSSALITEGGHVGEVSALFTEAVIRGEVTIREAGPTFYTRWGDWLAVTALTALAATLTWRWLQEAAGDSARRPVSISENLEVPE